MQILSPGSRIGQYEIASRPMMGGMGVVYFALDQGNDGRPVALKTFRPELLPDRAARDRFLREGTAWIELGSHPHIVRCYKIEYIDPTAFLVLELIAKEQNMPDASLRSWLIPGRPLPLEQALLFALQIARGMQYATEKISGFVHRDLKPENILVGADKLPGTNINRLRVTDFGLVKTVADSGLLVTNDNEELKPNQIQFTQGVGTPLYMAPEQWKGEPVGVFTDVYAFGCILYEMMMGQFRAIGQTINELQEAHSSGHLNSIQGVVPSTIQTLLGQCSALHATNRYQSWQIIVDTLEQTYADQMGKPAPLVSQNSEDSFEQQLTLGSAYVTIAASYRDLGNSKMATEHLEQALAISRNFQNQGKNSEALVSLSRTYLEGQTLTILGLTYADLGDTKRAMRYQEDALVAARKIADLDRRSLESTVLNNYGEALRNLGELQGAISYYLLALEIVRSIGKKHSEVGVMGNLGVAFAQSRDFQNAIKFLGQSLSLSIAIGDLRGEGAALYNLGCAYFDLGDTLRAIEHFKNASVRFREIGDIREIYALGKIGDAYQKLGDLKHAISYFTQKSAKAHAIGARSDKLNALGKAAIASSMLQDTPHAIEYFEQGLAIAREIGQYHDEGSFLGNLGKEYIRIGDVDKAVACLKQSLKIWRSIGAQRDEAMDLCTLGDIYKARKDMNSASSYYDQALSIARKTNDYELSNYVQNKQPGFFNRIFGRKG